MTLLTQYWANWLFLQATFAFEFSQWTFPKNLTNKRSKYVLGEQSQQPITVYSQGITGIADQLLPKKRFYCTQNVERRSVALHKPMQAIFEY